MATSDGGTDAEEPGEDVSSGGGDSADSDGDSGWIGEECGPLSRGESVSVSDIQIGQLGGGVGNFESEFTTQCSVIQVIDGNVSLECLPPEDDGEGGSETGEDSVLVDIEVPDPPIQIPAEQVELTVRYRVYEGSPGDLDDRYAIMLTDPDGSVLVLSHRHRTDLAGQLGLAPIETPLVECVDLVFAPCVQHYGWGVNIDGETVDVLDGETVEHEYDGHVYRGAGHGYRDLSDYDCDVSKGLLDFGSTFVRSDLIVK